jgi:hypothetical protein
VTFSFLLSAPVEVQHMELPHQFTVPKKYEKTGTPVFSNEMKNFEVIVPKFILEELFYIRSLM